MAADQLYVQATVTHSRVVLWECDNQHPNAEVYITKGFEGWVGRTPAVLNLCRTGDLKEVEPPDDADEGESTVKTTKLASRSTSGKPPKPVIGETGKPGDDGNTGEPK